MKEISEHYYNYGTMPWGNVSEGLIMDWIERYESYSNKYYKDRQDNPLVNVFG